MSSLLFGFLEVLHGVLSTFYIVVPSMFEPPFSILEVRIQFYRIIVVCMNRP